MAAVTSRGQESGDGNSSSIDDIWKSLKDLDNSANEEYKKRSSKIQKENEIYLEEKISKKKTSSKNKAEKKGKKKEKEGGGNGEVLNSKIKGRELVDETAVALMHQPREVKPQNMPPIF
jgi:hypothetical protein